jgi:prevent-host-death family protein
MAALDANNDTIRCGVYEAKTRLSELLELVSAGREVVITRRGHDIARLAPITTTRRREFGFDRGRVWISDDFDDPLPDDMLEDIT